MPRLFISHSSKDSVQALAFQRWLEANGWSKDDVFIDLHGIGAGERWRDTLRKANATCEAVILLASPDSIASVECQKELELAEALGKAIIPAILRDLTKDDPRLARYAERQFVDLSAEPTERMEPFEHDGKLHRVEFNLAALNSIKTRLEDLGVAPGSFVWPPKDKPNAEPYPGLSALGEEDAGIFFGREADIMSGLTKLRLVRRRGAPRLFVIQAASGAGKSSFLRAGLWPRLQRDRDFAPLAILRPAQGILTGPDGLGFQLAPWFARFGKTKTAGSINTAVGAATEAASAMAFGALLAEAAAVCTATQRATSPDARPPAPLIAIDQGEELFAAEDAQESDRFLNVLAALLKAPPEGVDPYVLITIRADSVEALLQRVAALGLDAPEPLYLPPLSPGAYRDVIMKPAEVYTKQVRRLTIEPALANQLVADATGADALPLLAFTMSQLFKLHAAGHELTLAQYNDIGGMGGCVTRVLRQAQKAAGAAGGDDSLRRLMVPGLATWDPAANAAKRLVARDVELVGGSRTALAPLANALVENRLLVKNRDTLEVAHEALLRRPPIDGWLEEQKDALKLRDDVLREAKEWADGGRHGDFVRRGTRLESALDLIGKPDFAAALAPASAYLAAGRKQEAAGRRRARLVSASIVLLMALVIAGLTARMYERELSGLWFQYVTARPYLVTAEAALAKKQADPFWDCAKTDADYSRHCPGMVVLPAGDFTMGSPDAEKDRSDNEGPLRKVTIKAPLAVSIHEVTFDQWDACVAAGGCKTVASDSGWPRGRRPVINVNWNDAREYVAWLSKMTGHSYRLLTEAEWEYAARAGNQGRWSFGDDEALLGDYAWFNSNSESKTQPAGKKKSNGFGLYDMHGNVWEWVQDCYVDTYNSAPTDGSSAPDNEDCSRLLRGGSWLNLPQVLRAAQRYYYAPGLRGLNLGFRVARTLIHTP